MYSVLKFKSVQYLIILVVFSMVSVNFSFACNQTNEFVWPDEVLYYYFYNSGPKIIPFPSTYCNFKKDIIFKNTKGELIGSFKVISTSRYKYDDLRSNIKTLPKVIELYQDTIKKNIEPVVFTDTLFRFMNSSIDQEFNKEIQFVSGVFTGNRNLLTWNPYTPSINHWNAININYKELMQMYLNQKVEFVYLEDDENIKFPKANLSPGNYSKIIKNEFPDFAYLNNRKVPTQEKEIVLFSSHTNTIRAYNYLTDMFFKNKKKIYWLNDANLKLINFTISESIDVVPNLKRISIKEVIEFIDSKKNHIILDISNLEYYTHLHFKNSVKLYLHHLNAKEFKKYYLKYYSLGDYNKLTERRKYLGDFIISGIHKIDKNSTVILTGNLVQDTARFLKIHDLMIRYGFKDINTLTNTPDEVMAYLKEKKLNPYEYFVEVKPTFLTIPKFSTND